MSGLRRTLTLVLDENELANCMRCGFCLPACPTYRETGLEAASPRGRIALMKAVVDGLMEPDRDFTAQMNLCLGCRACEPACPAGVRYGHLLEQARQGLERHAKHPFWVRWLRKFAFQLLLPRPKRLYFLGRLLSFYQTSGLQRLVRRLGLLKLLPTHLREMEAILPEASGRGLVKALGTFVPAKKPPAGPNGGAAAKAGMFRGCIMDVLFLQTNKNTVRLLAESGYDVLIPDSQNCCGALHAHSGEVETARELARSNIRAFKEAGVDYIVSNAGGCGAFLKEYGHLLKDDPVWAEDARWFAERVKDLSEMLVEAGENLPKMKPVGQRVTYQDSCHLRNVMKVARRPRQLLRQVAGNNFVELAEADRCCGSAGIYNLLQPEMAGRILDEKMEHVQRTKAALLVTSNPGCLLQMKLGIHRAGLEGRIRAVHLADLLAEQVME